MTSFDLPSWILEFMNFCYSQDEENWKKTTELSLKKADFWSDVHGM